MAEKRAIRKENTTMQNTRTAVTAVLAQVLAQVLVIPAALNLIGIRKRRERKKRQHHKRKHHKKQKKQKTKRKHHKRHQTSTEEDIKPDLEKYVYFRHLKNRNSSQYVCVFFLQEPVSSFM